MQDLDVLVDLLDYVKSRWAPGHVPRVGLGLRVHPEQKRDYALAFARSVDAAIARGNGTGRRAAASQTRKQALPSNIAAAPEAAADGKSSREEEDEMDEVETDEEQPSTSTSSQGRRRGGEAAAAESKSDGAVSVRYFEDPSWVPVECNIPWASNRVGITVVNDRADVAGRATGVLIVSVVTEGGTGAQAGVRQGDCVVAVEGKDVSGMACRDLLNSLRELLRVKRSSDTTLTLKFLFARPRRDDAPAKEAGDAEPKAAAAASSTGPASPPRPAPSSSSPARQERPSTDSGSAASAPPVAGHAYETQADLVTVGKLTEWCRAVAVGGRTCFVVTDVGDRRMARVQEGDILLSINGHDLSKGQVASADELSRLNGQVMLKFWRPAAEAADKKLPGDEGVRDEVNPTASSPVQEEEEEVQQPGGREGEMMEEEDNDATIREEEERSPAAAAEEEESRPPVERRREEEDEGRAKRLKGGEGQPVYRSEPRGGEEEEEERGGAEAMEEVKQQEPPRAEELVVEGQQQDKTEVQPHSLAEGDVVWCRLGKLPRWPAVVQGVEGETARIKFFGDWQVEVVAVKALELFESGFKKLFKKRYEKVYVRSVSAAVQYVMKRRGWDYEEFGEKVGVWPQVLQKYMEEDALPKAEGQKRSAKQQHPHGSSAAGGGLRVGRHSSSNEAAAADAAPPEEGERRWRVLNYDIDPELFKETKRNGIKSEAWF